MLKRLPRPIRVLAWGLKMFNLDRRLSMKVRVVVFGRGGVSMSMTVRVVVFGRGAVSMAGV